MPGNTFRLKVSGGRELDAALRALDRKVSGKLSRQAMRAGAKVALPEVRKRAPKASGAMAASFKVRAGKRRKGRIAYQVQTKAGDYKGDTFYGAFVSFGHRAGPRKLGNARPLVPANPFIEAAFKVKRQAMLDAVVDTLRKGLT
jgi:HK97 gp10 family phage protein